MKCRFAPVRRRFRIGYADRGSQRHRGPGRNDLPRLFRATADELEARRVDFDMIIDVTVEERARGDEPFWVVTVTTADDDGSVAV
jgi:hypothetical protein